MSSLRWNKDPILAFVDSHMNKKVDLYNYQLYLLGIVGVCFAATIIVYIFFLCQTLHDLQVTLLLLKAECVANQNALTVLKQTLNSLPETATVVTDDPLSVFFMNLAICNFCVACVTLLFIRTFYS